MVKKSRRQRKGATERVNPYNVVDQDISGKNTDFVETSVACDESSSTMFQPNHEPGRPPLQPTMHAVASNGERLETFSTNGVDSPAEGGEGKVAYNKPCPKSKKSRGSVQPEDVGEAKEVLEEEDVVEEGEKEDVVEEGEKEDVREEGEKEDVREEGEGEKECQPINGHEQGNEGIVTEPEELLDPETPNKTDPDVTISFLEAEEDRSDADETKEGFTAFLQAETEPLIEFPTDSPEKPSQPQPVDDGTDSNVDDGIEPGLVVTESEPEPEEKDPDSSEERERGFKILHRLRNPSLYTDAYTVSESTTDRRADYSFGRSLRSLSGRPTLKTLATSELDDSFLAGSSYPTFFNFGFGKRKAEEDEGTPKEREPKRAKAEEGEESLGFFARLTSPVINRLRGIKVVTPSHAGEEVTGHEEMAVVPVAPPASKRCVVM